MSYSGFKYSQYMTNFASIFIQINATKKENGRDSGATRGMYVQPRPLR